MRDPRPTLAWHLVPAGDVDYINYIVGQLSAVIRREVVWARETGKEREREGEGDKRFMNGSKGGVCAAERSTRSFAGTSMTCSLQRRENVG